LLVIIAIKEWTYTVYSFASEAKKKENFISNVGEKIKLRMFGFAINLKHDDLLSI